jgi:uncharacterized protein YdcH (DUF465 family)
MTNPQTPTEPVAIHTLDSAWSPIQGERPAMEKFSAEELKAYLMESNEAFRKLAEEHSKYNRLIEEIESKPHVTPEDEVEEHRLKKLKLVLKDQMHRMIEQYKTQQVA